MTDAAPESELVFLTTADVMEKLGVSKTTLKRIRRDDVDFPDPVVMSHGDGRRRSIRWVKGEVEAYMKKKILARQG
ncbi:helix-turn-helix domain-containing protein [Halomonas sp. NO4]|uniref:helix-turn-helix transcriptional regulator n=1 Tax=Halomonas sp. NO4 TaxID=2484813 RepID=UPI0013D1C437|nr:helix-turn-helix domain-containing protein [Halomonas sp. NO4]